MTKKDFLAAIRSHLTQLPTQEVEKALNFYAEMIEDRIEEGMSEEAAVASMEDPAVIAERIMYEMPLSTLVKSKAKAKAKQGQGMPAGIKVLLIILAIFSCPVWLPVVLTILGAIFAIFAFVWVAIIVLVAGVIGIAAFGVFIFIAGIVYIFSSPLRGLLFLGISLVCIGCCILIYFLVRWCVRMLVRFSKWLGRQIKSLFIKGGKSK